MQRFCRRDLAGRKTSLSRWQLPESFPDSVTSFGRRRRQIGVGSSIRSVKMVPAPADDRFLADVNEIEGQGRVGRKMGMQRVREIQDFEPKSQDPLTGIFRSYKRQPEAVAADLKTIRLSRSQQDLEPFAGTIDRLSRAVFGNGRTENRPGLQRQAEFDIDIRRLEAAKDRKAKIDQRLQPPGIEGKSRPPQIVGNPGQVLGNEKGQGETVVEVVPPGN